MGRIATAPAGDRQPGREQERRRRLTGILLVLGLALAACAPGEENLAVVANSPGTLEVGAQRLLVGYLAETGEFLARPELMVEADFYFAEESEPRVTSVGVFQPTVPGVRGIYRFSVELDEAGTWQVVLRPEDRGPTPPTSFLVSPDAITPGIGDPAPRSDSATSTDSPLEAITTDPHPDPELYELSVADAVTSGQPSVIVFATPAFCTTATCGPTLDIVKGITDRYPDTSFVHVEVFENLDATSFDDLVVVPAVAEWALPSEPWVFVVDAGGRVAAAFEGTVAEDELTSALESVAG